MFRLTVAVIDFKESIPGVVARVGRLLVKRRMVPRERAETFMGCTAKGLDCRRLEAEIVQQCLREFAPKWFLDVGLQLPRSLMTLGWGYLPD